MNSTNTKAWFRAAVCGFGLMATAAVGCQSTISGQTLPSNNYLRDDVQYFTAGPEDRLPNLRRKLEEYRLRQQNVADGLADQPPAPGVP